MRLQFSQLLFVVIFLLTSCNTDSSDTVIVARVESSVLTTNDLTTQLGSGASAEDQRSFTKRWIERELLYYAALDAKINKDSSIEHNLRESERNLLSMTYLNRNVESGPVTITSEEVEQFYTEHSTEYVRNDDVIRFAVYSLSTVRDAWNIRNGLTENNFFSSASRYSKVSVIPKLEIPFVTKSSLPTDIQEKLFDIRVGGITTPIRVGEYVNLYLILDKGDKGSGATFNEVRDEVKAKLMREQYKVRIDSVMNVVKNERSYSFNHEYFDTTTPVVVTVEGENDE